MSLWPINAGLGASGLHGFLAAGLFNSSGIVTPMSVLTTAVSAVVAVANAEVIVTSAATDTVKLSFPVTGASGKAVGSVTVVDNQSLQDVRILDNRGRLIHTVAPETTARYRALTSDGFSYESERQSATPAATLADISTTSAVMSTAERQAFNSVLALLRANGLLLP